MTACSVGPKYSKPSIPTPSNWIVLQNQTSVAWPSHEWWQGFASPELNSLMHKAELTNDDLQAAIARVQEADAQARIAGATLLPEVSAGGTATHEREPISGLGMKTSSQYNPLLSASYALDFWGKNRDAQDAARATALASRYDRVTVELTVMSSVATAYFQVLQFNDRIHIAEKNLNNAQQTLHGLQVEQSVGTTTALDVAQQDTTVSTLLAAIPPLKQQMRQTLDVLATLTGQLPESIALPTDTLADISEPIIRLGLPSELLARRPDVAETEADLIAANANIKAARAAFFPGISLTADGGFISGALSTALSPANHVFALSAGITQPIFQGGALQGQYDYNKARYAELLANYHKSVITAFSNTEGALVAIQQTADQQQRQQAVVDKARHAYDLTNMQFHAGTIDILTVLNTENALFTAEDTLAQVKLSHLQALLQLFNALGGGWQQTESTGQIHE